MTLPTAIIGVVGTPQMVFTNPIMTTHVNRTVDQPPLSSMVVGTYINADVTNPKRGYREPYVITVPILDHIDGHYIKPKKVTFKYLDFK